MKDIITGYAAYHAWANTRIAEVLKKLPEAKLDQEIVSSFDSLRKTVYHMWDAESVWHQRLQLVEQTVKPATGFDGSFEEAVKLWLQQSVMFSDFIKQATPVKLQHVVAYYNSRKQYCKFTVIEILMHVFNHATYHRGQLVTMLRQAGINKIPVTDYNEFMRVRKV